MGYSLASVFSGDFSNEMKSKNLRFEKGSFDVPTKLTKFHFSFDVAFPDVPAVLLTIIDADPDANATVNNITTSGFDVYTTRDSMTCQWLAVGSDIV